MRDGLQTKNKPKKFRACIASWLHRRADTMNNPRATENPVDVDMWSFIGLVNHCADTGQTPTEWSVGEQAHIALYERYRRRCGSERQLPPKRLMGIPVVLDCRLPPSKVVLRAGENTVGAVNFQTEENIE